MRCEDLKKKFINGELQTLSDKELLHLSDCNSCKAALNKAIAAIKKLESADIPSFNPFFTSRVMAKIAQRNEQPISARIRYALVASVVITLLVGSLTVYIAHNSSNPQQPYDLLSFNDFTQQPITFDK